MYWGNRCGTFRRVIYWYCWAVCWCVEHGGWRIRVSAFPTRTLGSIASTQVTLRTAKYLDIEQNELELVYRARGMTPEDASHRALERLGYLSCDCNPSFSARPDGSQGPEEELTQEAFESVGNPWKVAFSSFLFFASGAIIPVLPFLFGAIGVTALMWALGLVSVALLITGGIVGLLSGASPSNVRYASWPLGWVPPASPICWACSSISNRSTASALSWSNPTVNSPCHHRPYRPGILTSKICCNDYEASEIPFKTMQGAETTLSEFEGKAF